MMNLLEKLRNESARGARILVEGRKDSEALRLLEVQGPIFCIKSSGNVLADQLDRIEAEEVLLLTDFDREGEELFKEACMYLESRGVKVRGYVWRKMKAVVERDVKDVEGIPGYLERLKKSFAK